MAAMVARSAVTAAQRTAAPPGQPEAMRGRPQVEAGLTGAIGRLVAVAESYPEPKADQNLLSLREELPRTVAFARQADTDSVMEDNVAHESFLGNVLAGVFQFRKAEHLQATESPEGPKAPLVSFS